MRLWKSSQPQQHATETSGLYRRECVPMSQAVPRLSHVSDAEINFAVGHVKRLIPRVCVRNGPTAFLPCLRKIS